MYKILIVEDDKTLCNNIKEGISKWSFNGVAVEDFEDILQEFAKHNPHLVIMDINLPYYDGFYWCRKIREISKVPIIFLSSRDSNMDIVMAVNMGGDDYVTKPFSMDILLAKMQALIRRTYSYGQGDGQIIECEGAILNINDGTLTYNGENIELTKNEFKILQLLMRNKGKIVSRDKIMRVLWESEYFISENTLTVNVNRLRNKLENIGLKDFIVTKKSQGYMIP
ncbi:response regulator transcription factor [Tepidimicrobium xylanilyticum]|uniref:DNA-binding response regulator, OmpR family, contains REC and winged-helix (WHTH) domain n=1 Tax=Tepidimicrobium xylanilyticum TaxID=1123352 RepID=A0A1H2XGA5_9FIRM|nr:response regulator transcription factor [Tepidimicrobium xylanilyticum]SDW91880.1 DNA-binding response regulator, OmpR family, contains REC and winged-helix (wHTH) domain [Tepidimicrobium xylanilyticum]